MNDKGPIRGHFSRRIDKLVVGGLHRDDFDWATTQYEDIGYVLVAFVLDRDCYHWKAVYVKVSQLEKRVGGRESTRLCLSMSADGVNAHNDAV